jgi:hypothetical protein
MNGLINDERCNEDIYLNGVLVATVDISSKAAKTICEILTKETGCLHDFYAAGGRVIIKKELSKP